MSKETEKTLCKGCNKNLPQAQIDYMLWNPEYERWCREGFCSLACFERQNDDGATNTSQSELPFSVVDLRSENTSGKMSLDIAKEKNPKKLSGIFDQSQVSNAAQHSNYRTAFPNWAAILLGGAIGIPSGLFLGYSLYKNYSEYGEFQYLYIWGIVNFIICRVLLRLSIKTFLIAMIMTLIFGFIGYNIEW